VRRLASQKRVGHAGTLDPMASGVLPVLLGRATRLADFIQQGRKTYTATVCLGASTDTDDAEGSITSSMPVPALSQEILATTLAQFQGEILQTPPAYSALQLILEVTCSKGTYIRALARDIAVALGTLGHLTALVRTRVGQFSIDDALSLDEIATRGVEAALVPASHAIPDAPTFSASAEQTLKLLNGQPIPMAMLRAESVWVYDPTGSLVCLAAADGTLVRPRLAL
jgi:tRNA pseudouridine55 synthase